MQDELDAQLNRINETDKRLNKAYENYLKSVEAVNAELKELRAYKQRVEIECKELMNFKKPLSSERMLKIPFYEYHNLISAIMGDGVNA